MMSNVKMVMVRMMQGGTAPTMEERSVTVDSPTMIKRTSHAVSCIQLQLSFSVACTPK